MTPGTINNPGSGALGERTLPAAAQAPRRERTGLFQSRMAWMCGAFTVAVGVTMLISHIAARNEDPLNSSQLKDLKEQLRQSPTDEQLKGRIRALDLDLRERHFRHLSRMSSGVWLLLIGSGLFILVAGRAVALSRKPVLPSLRKPDPSGHPRAAQFSRFAVAAAGAATGAGLLWIMASAPRSVLPAAAEKPSAPPDGTAQAGSAPDCASPAELARQWPGFRGPGGGGQSFATNLPASWDAASGQGIVWRVESPAPGFNSPVIFGGNVYLAGGDASKLDVICLRLADGQVAWRKALERGAVSPTGAEIPESTGYSPCTIATDGRRVYAIFATGDLGAFTTDGNRAWSKAFGALKNPYGHATSLTSWRDRVVVQLDQGESEDGKSMLYALDGRTGRPVWQRPRKVGASWASPIVIDAAGKTQIITLSLPWVIAYSAVDGAELWRVECLNGEVTPSPVFAGGLLLVASPSDRIVAIRPDGAGDVTKSNIVWSYDENVPDVTSPASNGELLFMTTTSGALTCLDVKDGKKLWEHELEMECHASPAIAENKVYQFGQDGGAVVVQAGREYKELFRGKMPDSFHASPAFVDDRIVLRGMTNIWCLGFPGKEPGK